MAVKFKYSKNVPFNLQHNATVHGSDMKKNDQLIECCKFISAKRFNIYPLKRHYVLKKICSLKGSNLINTFLK